MINRLLLLLVPLAFFACEPKPVEEPDPVVNPEPEPKPEVPKVVEPVAVSFVKTNIFDMTMSRDENSGEYTLVTTGTDPYIFTAALGTNLDETIRILSFEYQCSSGINDLQVFYGSAISEARSRHFGPIPASSGWSEYSCSIAADRKAFSWGFSSDNLRFDFGTKKGVTIRIRDLKVRTMNEAELREYEGEQNKAANKEAEAEHIAGYMDKTFSCSVTSVSVGSNEITVQGTTDGASGYYVADVAPWESLTEMETFPNKLELSGSSFTVKFPRFINRDGLPGYDRLLSRFAVVRVQGDKQTLASHARYADSVNPLTSPAAVKPASKKGLGGFIINGNLSDLDDLGISSVTVNIVLNSVVNTVKSGNYTIEHKFGGVTYYMDKGYAGQLDKVMKECYKRNIVVSAILLNRQTDTNSKATPLMKHPECDGGNYSMPNLTEAAAVNVYAAALDFLAKRYSSSTYGRIHHWILHNEVDFQKEWTNMGDQPEWRYMDSYIKSMRICHNLAHQYDPNAVVMISLTHCWAKAEGQYAPKSLLEDLCKDSAAEGDFLWGVAYHPYPQNLTLPEFWKNDTRSTYSDNSDFCTFKNLEVVSNWVIDSKHYYKGTEKRLLFLSENGTNSPSYSETDLAKQAAGAAWAWKKVSRLSGIDGIQWHNWQDNRAEGGLRIGLRRFPDDSDQPNGKKPSWYVWQAAGTSSEDAVFQPYLSVIGVNDWNQIFN